MRLSVCLIVRNEENNLPRALGSVADLFDELIVVDTGSTDHTVDIATDFGARVSYFQWCDDFSAARNHALDQARGEWIFWLDADEELLLESRHEIKRCMAQQDALAFFVLRQDLVDANRLDYFTRMWQLRLFRNRPQLRFRGRCHPDFHPPIQTFADQLSLHVKPSEVTIRHYGYIGEMRRQKLLRAARLLELELADRPGQLYYQIEFGRTLALLGDHRAAGVLTESTEEVWRHRDDPTSPMPLVSTLFEYLLQLPKKGLPEFVDRRDLLSLADKWFPTAAPLVWIMAQQAFAREDFETAEHNLRLLVRMGDEASYDQYVSFDPRIVGEDALLNLGVCLVRQAKLSEAAQCFERLIQQGMQVKDATANLKTIKRLRQRYKAGKKRKRS